MKAVEAGMPFTHTEEQMREKLDALSHIKDAMVNDITLTEEQRLQTMSEIQDLKSQVRTDETSGSFPHENTLIWMIIYVHK